MSERTERPNECHYCKRESCQKCGAEARWCFDRMLIAEALVNDAYVKVGDVKEEIDEWLDTVGYATIGKGLSYYNELMGCIESAPTADVAPVLHGRWDKRNDDVCYWYVCSVCETEPPKMKWGGDWFSAYCPNCGARMDGGEDDE